MIGYEAIHKRSSSMRIRTSSVTAAPPLQASMPSGPEINVKLARWVLNACVCAFSPGVYIIRGYTQPRITIRAFGQMPRAPVAGTRRLGADG